MCHRPGISPFPRKCRRSQNNGRAKVGKIMISSVTKASQRRKISLSRNVPTGSSRISFFSYILVSRFYFMLLYQIPHVREYMYIREIIFRTRSTYLRALSRLHDLFLRYFNVPEIRTPPFAVIDAAVSKSRYDRNKLPRFVR